MAFAIPAEDGVTAFKERTVQDYALDDFIGVVGAVAAWLHRRRRRQLDSPAFAGCLGGVGPSANYGKTSRRLTLTDGACRQLSVS